MPAFNIRAIITIVMLSSLFGLGACGQKGPLYIPEPETQQQAPVGQAVIEETAEEKNRSKTDSNNN